MTCVVAYKDENKIYFGSDTIGIDPTFLDKETRKDEKIFQKHDMLFGFSGSFRIGQVIKYILEIPEHENNLDVMEYMVAVFIPELIECVKENVPFKQSEDENIFSEMGLLIGYKGRLFVIDDDLQVGETYFNYASIGCGENIAKGAFFAMKDMPIPIEDKLKIALEAASTFSAGVNDTFVFKTLDID